MVWSLTIAEGFLAEPLLWAYTATSGSWKFLITSTNTAGVGNLVIFAEVETIGFFVVVSKFKRDKWLLTLTAIVLSKAFSVDGISLFAWCITVVCPGQILFKKMPCSSDIDSKHFKAAEIVGTKIGATSKSNLLDWIKENI